MSYVPMYDVNAAVGTNCANSPKDVMLVQYFLASIYLPSTFGWDTPRVFRSGRFGPGADPLFPVNGRFTPGLAQWIDAFQRSANEQNFGPLIADGKINHANSAWGNRGTKSGGRFTIQALNEVLLLTDKQRFWNLPDDPGLPGALASELKIMRVNRTS